MTGELAQLNKHFENHPENEINFKKAVEEMRGVIFSFIWRESFHGLAIARNVLRRGGGVGEVFSFRFRL